MHLQRPIVSLALAVAAAVSAGCVSYDYSELNQDIVSGNPALATMSAASVDAAIKSGTTTRAQVEAMLGAPEDVTNVSDGTSMVSYTYGYMSIARNINQHTVLLVWYDNAGVVKQTTFKRG